MSLRARYLAAAVAGMVLAGCGGSTKLIEQKSGPTQTVRVKAPNGPVKQLGFPIQATENTTRSPWANPISNAAEIALATFPSAAPGTHPTAVTLVSTEDWQAALAASVLMAAPIRSPILLSDSPTALPALSASTLKQLAPTGARQLKGTEVIRVGDVPTPTREKIASINGNDPYTLAVKIDRFLDRIDGRPSINVVIASGTQPAWAMPAAGWAAESGEPILFVTPNAIPAATRQALRSNRSPHIYVLGPASVISNTVLAQLRNYGSVKRIGSTASSPAALSVAFAEYRDPACPPRQPCAHLPNSFGWAMRSPGHGYVLLNQSQPLDAAAAAPLSGSGSYGPQLLIQSPTAIPRPVLYYLLNYAADGYNQYGPTVASINHGWVVGDTAQVSESVQAQFDHLRALVPVK